MDSVQKGRCGAEGLRPPTSRLFSPVWPQLNERSWNVTAAAEARTEREALPASWGTRPAPAGSSHLSSTQEGLPPGRAPQAPAVCTGCPALVAKLPRPAAPSRPQGSGSAAGPLSRPDGSSLTPSEPMSLPGGNAPCSQSKGSSFLRAPRSRGEISQTSFCARNWPPEGSRRETRGR